MVALLVVVALGLCPQGAAAEPDSALSHAGRWLIDARGRVVVLHGMNVVAKRPPYSVTAMGFGADDAAWLRAAGFSAVRLGVVMTGLWPAPDGFSEAYLDDVEAAARTAAAAGLWVLIDLHQDYYTESTGGEGFPGWMVHTALPGGVTVPGVRRDAPVFDAFWRNEGGVQDVVATAWGRLAARLRDVPRLAGYDLLNEPYPGSSASSCASVAGCPAFDRRALGPFYARVVRAVRASDPTGLVWYEPQVVFNQGAASSVPSLGDPAAGFSFHVYCSERATVPQPCLDRRARAFANAEAQATAGGRSDALLLTEFGATDDVAELTRVADLADAARVGWLQWAYWNEDPFAARPHEGLVRGLDAVAPPGAAGNVKADKLAALARPYPRLVAGTPSNWSWDAAAGVFSASWSTARADGRGRFGPGAVSELELPAASFPRGWRVSVRGGRVRGHRAGGVLRVVARPRAEVVSVRVTRR